MKPQPLISIDKDLLAFLMEKPDRFVSEENPKDNNPTSDGLPLTSEQAWWFLKNEDELHLDYGIPKGETVRFAGYGSEHSGPGCSWAGMCRADVNISGEDEDGLTIEDFGDYVIEAWFPDRPRIVNIVDLHNASQHPVSLSNKNAFFTNQKVVSVMRDMAIEYYASKKHRRSAVTQVEFIQYLVMNFNFEEVQVAAIVGI
jgi:hypothetical protein